VIALCSLCRRRGDQSLGQKVRTTPSSCKSTFIHRDARPLPANQMIKRTQSAKAFWGSRVPCLCLLLTPSNFIDPIGKTLFQRRLAQSGTRGLPRSRPTPLWRAHRRGRADTEECLRWFPFLVSPLSFPQAQRGHSSTGFKPSINERGWISIVRATVGRRDSGSKKLSAPYSARAGVTKAVRPA